MTALLSILAFTAVAMVLGKRANLKGPGWYTIIVIVTILQVAAVVYQMFTMESPTS